MKYSIIVPVFNRPDEVDELLESLCRQKVKDFEVLIVEDGSQRDCKAVVDKYADRLHRSSSTSQTSSSSKSVKMDVLLRQPDQRSSLPGISNCRKYHLHR